MFLLRRDGVSDTMDGIISVHNTAEEAEFALLELILKDEPGFITIKQITWDGRTVMGVQ